MMSAPFPVIELDEVDSTNAEALRRAALGEAGPVWIRTNRQTAGRGRAGRSWIAAPGNLAATLLFAPGAPLAVLHQLSFVSGLAVFDAVEGCRPRQVDLEVPSLLLKWPNDILAGTRGSEWAKLCGILIESTTNPAGVLVAAIGIGLNIRSAPAIDGRSTAALGDWQTPPAPGELLAAIDTHMRRWLAIWDTGSGFAAVRSAWLERAHAAGTPLTLYTGALDTGGQAICGTFAGIDETGALLLSSVDSNPNDIRRFTYGDVSLPPPRAI